MRSLRPEPGPIVASKLRRLCAPGFIEQNAVISVLVALRLEVHLPDAHGVVAGIPERPRLGVAISLAHGHHVQHAVVPGGEASQQGAASRRAGGTRRIGAPKPDSLGTDPVHVRCPESSIPRRRRAVPPMLVIHDEQNVRLGGRAHGLAVQDGWG